MRLWFRVLLLSCVVTVVLVGSLGAEQTTRVGRWVNVDAANSFFRLIVLDVEPDGTVHHLIPMPQFGATYRVNADRVHLTWTAGPLGVPKGDKGETYVIKGDTLLDENGKPLFTRFLDAPRKQDSIQGPWRHVDVSDPMERFMTFRSDGQVVFEVGMTGSVTITGDTLKINWPDPRGPFAIRLVGETLYVETPGKQERFVRRPWGCFGIEFDATAPECR